MSKPGSESQDTAAKDPRRETARQLWERLGKSRPGPSNNDLIYLARFVPLLATSAIKTLFARTLSVAELKELVQHVPRAQELAVKRLIENFADQVSEDDLRFVLTETKIPEVAKLLLKRFPTDSNLNLVDRTTESLKDSVVKLRTMETTAAIMKEIDKRL